MFFLLTNVATIKWVNIAKINTNFDKTEQLLKMFNVYPSNRRHDMIHIHYNLCYVTVNFDHINVIKDGMDLKPFTTRELNNTSEFGSIKS